MNTLYSRGNDMDDDPELDERNNREISLGTSFIVGIFFALILICAIFFAFGYSLGRRSVLPASGVPTPATRTSTAKPASGIPETQGSANTDTTDQENSPVAKESPAAATVAIKPTPVTTPAQSTATMPGIAAPVVQVAAVSRQGDANMLMAALKRRGYNAAIHQAPQDKLLHVQIGPFATKKEAEAMRQRLISDGYNAIVK